MKFRPFEEAKDYVRTLKLKNRREWRAYSKSITKPPDIPANPEEVYREQWNGMGDWLGTGTLRPQDMKFLPFEKAKEFVHSLGLKSHRQNGQNIASLGKDQRIFHPILMTHTRNIGKGMEIGLVPVL